MPLTHHLIETDESRRYDLETVQRVVDQAYRLQLEQQETMSAPQIERLATEVGLEPKFVRKALSKVVPRNRRRLSKTKRREFYGLLAGLGIPVIWGAISLGVMLAIRSANQTGEEEWGVFASLFAPTLLAFVQGLLIRRKPPAFCVGLYLCIWLAPAFWQFIAYGLNTSAGDAWVGAIAYVLFGGPIAGAIAALGATAAQHYFPDRELMDED